MHVHAVTPILNVSDVPASIRWFESLGWHRGLAVNHRGKIAGGELEDEHGPATFGGVCANGPGQPEGPNVLLCKDGQGHRDPMTRPDPDRDDFGAVWMSWWVADVDAAHAEAVRAGVEVVRPPVNEPWGVREFLIRHPDGHCFRMSGAAEEEGEGGGEALSAGGKGRIIGPSPRPWRNWQTR
jgi:catechol 2,3-dioxygenase-like lactoylglutathione lyase family enzyme